MTSPNSEITGPLIKFDFESDIVKTFTEGSCLNLAAALVKALNQSNGDIFEVTTVQPLLDWGPGLHYLVKPPLSYLQRFGLDSSKEEYCVDILGIWTKQQVLSCWEDRCRNHRFPREEYPVVDFILRSKPTFKPEKYLYDKGLEFNQSVQTIAETISKLRS